MCKRSRPAPGSRRSRSRRCRTVGDAPSQIPFNQRLTLGLQRTIMYSGHRQPPLSHSSAKSCPVSAASDHGTRDGVRNGRPSNPRSDSICRRNICCRVRHGRGGFCFWHRRRGGVAAFSIADPYNGTDRGLWTYRAGHLRLETAPFDKACAAAAFLLGGVIGVPIGVQLLHWTPPATLRISIGIVLILFSLYNLMRPQLAPAPAGKTADGAIGVLNGVIGGT